MKNEPKIAATATPIAVIDRAAFSAAVEKIKLVTVTRDIIPILANVKLAAEAGDLVLTGTDISMDIRIRVPGEVDSRFSTTVPVSLLASMCSKSPKSDRIVMSLPAAQEDNTGDNASEAASARFEFGKAVFWLQTISPTDFPEAKTFKAKPHRFALPGSTLWNAFDAVKAAISTEETRYYLNGVYFHLASDATYRYDDDAEGGKSLFLRATATDGHRLYSQTMSAAKGSLKMPGVIIPSKAVNVLHKLLKGKFAPRQVDIKMDEELFVIGWDNVQIATKLVDGEFPDYGRVMPTGNDKVATLDAKDLNDTLQAVTVIASERGRAVKAVFEGGKCTLSVNNPDTGAASSDLGCDYEGERIEIGFNADYLTSMIANACPAGGDIVFQMASASDPILIRGEENGWLGVLMPMRV
ncbi:DNA polymerase III subunit beta [Mesorhizobium sp. NBSH29]|uniref:DNA polymerase III subunit beta n=1 Tax=Mesorhizobium sp. NBSH29 TaxID=2654249 RepID=UPI00189640E8|nr:DNA polymerase III subunit beta [Mesorhizobium sp. NBSH29]